MARIKFFSRAKGFGIIVSDGAPDRVVNKRTVIQSGFTLSQMQENVEVEFEPSTRSGNRPSVARILSLNGVGPSRRPTQKVSSLKAGMKAVGAVKFFLEAKSYGFLLVETGEIFFHRSDLPPGLDSKSLQAGDSFHFTVIEHEGRLKAVLGERYVQPIKPQRSRQSMQTKVPAFA